MADSFSANLKVRLPATGAYDNTWGATLNSDALSLLDAAVAGTNLFSVGTSVAFSLPAQTNGTTSTTRNFAWQFTGTPATECTVTIPASVPSAMKLVINSLTVDILLTYIGSNNTVTVAPGEYRIVYMDGTDVWVVTAGASDAATVGGIAAANFMRQSRTAAEIAASTIVTNVLQIPTSIPWFAITEEPTIPLDFNNGNAQQVTLTGNRTVPAIANAVDGAEIWFLVVQDGTGNRTLAWDSSYIFEGGMAPTLSTGGGGADLFFLKTNSALGRTIVLSFGNLSSGAATVPPLTITQNCSNLVLAPLVGNPSTAVNVTLKINPGVVINSITTGLPALDLSGLPGGSTVNLVNAGYVQGMGGQGSDGYGGLGGISYGFTVYPPASAQAGGAAIKGPGSGVNFNINNGGGIWGGGGGGGAAGVKMSTGATDLASGAPGGGGAGGGLGGKAAKLGLFSGGGLHVVGTDGTTGLIGPISSGAGGLAGSGAGLGTGNSGTGGAGGDWGQPGVAGTAGGGSGSQTLAPNTAGAAGNAINLNGGSYTLIAAGSILGAIAP